MGETAANTLEVLENDYWGEPEWPSHLVTTLHRLRSKPLDQFTTEDLRINIGQESSLDILMPMAIEVLEKDPFADGDNYRGDLLQNVLRNAPWLIENPVLMERVATVVQSVVKKGFVDEMSVFEEEETEIRKIVEAFVAGYLDHSKG